MAPKDPYADSPYDAAGMPMGTTTADYDNTEERRKSQVKTRPVEQPESINEIDYQPEETEAEAEFKKRRKNDDEFKLGFNSAIELPLPYDPKASQTEEDDLFLEEDTKKEDKKK